MTSKKKDGNLRALEGEVLRKQQPAKQTAEPTPQIQGTDYDPKILESLRNPYPGTMVAADKPKSGPRSLLASPVARNLESPIPGGSTKKGRIRAEVQGIDEGGTTREMESTTNDQKK